MRRQHEVPQLLELVRDDRLALVAAGAEAARGVLERRAELRRELGVVRDVGAGRRGRAQLLLELRDALLLQRAERALRVLEVRAPQRLDLLAEVRDLLLEQFLPGGRGG